MILGKTYKIPFTGTYLGAPIEAIEFKVLYKSIITENSCSGINVWKYNMYVISVIGKIPFSLIDYETLTHKMNMDDADEM